MLAACGVPKTDYEALQKENRELQKVIDQANDQLRQLQTQLHAAQQGLVAIPALEQRAQELQRLLTEKEAEMNAVQARFDKFKAERRDAMIGREYPSLRLEDGKELRNARITGIADGELSIRHADGFIKVALAKSSEALRWQACFEPAEEAADARRRMLAEAARINSHLDRARQTTTDNQNVVREQKATAAELRRTITAQRAALNQAHSALAAQNPGALRGAHWNSARPEDSGLINVFSERRAVFGINELDSLAAAIKANLRRLRELDPGADAP